MEEHKNLIVYWKGGGYSGCVWEPNMGFFDGDGEWHPVISTGCGALDTKEDVEAEMKKQEDPNIEDWEKSDLLTFPIEGEHPLEWLCTHVRIDYVAVLADALVEAGYSVDMKCDGCGEWFSSDDYKFRDIVGIMADSGFYKGDGGIGVIVTDIWCDDCRHTSECPACCDMNNPTTKDLEDKNYWKEKDFSKKFAYDELGICEFCWERFQYDHDGCWDSASQEWKPSGRWDAKGMERLPNDIKVGKTVEFLEESQEKKSERWDAPFLDGMRKYAKWQTDEGVPRADIEAALVRQLLIPTDDEVNYLMKVPSAFAYGAVRNLLIPLALKYFGSRLDHIEFEPTDLTEFWKEVFNG